MTTPTIQTNTSVLHSSDGFVDLYVLDASNLGGSVYHFSPQSYSDGTLLSWGGQSYQVMPIGIDSAELMAKPTTLPRPTLTISNVGAPLISAIVALGDLVGAKLIHYRTKVSYLDGQANADTTRYQGPTIWYIFQKVVQTNQTIQFALASVLDRPGLMFPIRQVLKDPNINPPDGIYFPGVQPYRIQG